MDTGTPVERALEAGLDSFTLDEFGVCGYAVGGTIKQKKPRRPREWRIEMDWIFILFEPKHTRYPVRAKYQPRQENLRGTCKNPCFIIPSADEADFDELSCL
jgi:hypothetical protein